MAGKIPPMLPLRRPPLEPLPSNIRRRRALYAPVRKRRRWPYYGSFRKRRMPYRRYGRKRRRFSKKRRRTNKRRRYRSFRSRVRRSVVDMQPDRTWKNEGQIGRTCAVGQTLFWIPWTNGSAVDLNAALLDTGENSRVLGGADQTDAVKYFARHVKCDSYLRNVSEHAIHLQVFWCVARSHIEDETFAGAKATALGYLAKGWSDRLLDTDETAIGLATANDAVESDMNNITPYESSAFVSHYKIVKRTSRTLQPAQSMSISMKKGRFTFRKFDVYQTKEDALGGITMFPLVKFCGSLGHLLADTDSVGSMSLTLGCEYRKEIKFTYTVPHQPAIAVTNAKATSGDYEAPADHMEVADDNA